MDEERQKWRGIGSEPVSAQTPSGESVRYDPDFERLQAEMQKLENLSGEPVDWKLVVSLSQEILKNKSKDLLVGSYLVMGLLETDGLLGFSNGLSCLEGLISDHWPSLFPVAKRMRARINALNWLSEKAGAVITRSEPDKGDGAILSTCGDQVKTLEVLLQDKLGQEDPGLADLSRPIQEHLNRILTENGAPAKSDAGDAIAEPKPKVETKPLPVTTAPLSASFETFEDARRTLKDSFSILKRVASFVRHQDPVKPLPYRLVRFLTWCDIDNLPPAKDGRSRIQPPPNQLRDRFQGLIEQSAWKELLNQTEGRVAEFPFWLDLHQTSDTALAGLGQDYANASQAVKSEVASLLSRLPNLVDLQFSDGTPFANETTRNWISTQIFPAKDAERIEAVAPDMETGFLDELQKKSRQLLQEGEIKAALSLVQDAARSAPTQRQKFLAQTELANLCVAASQVKAALAHLEMLDDQITKFSLDVWEPQLAYQVLMIYWQTLNKAIRETKQPAPEISRLSDSVYARLCRLDVLAGLNATKRN